jgi:hypothetical protein
MRWSSCIWERQIKIYFMNKLGVGSVRGMLDTISVHHLLSSRLSFKNLKNNFVLHINTGNEESKAVPPPPCSYKGDRRDSSYSFTSVLDRGERSAPRPGHALPLGKEPPVPIVEESGRAPEPVWTQRLQEKSLAATGIDSRTSSL